MVQRDGWNGIGTTTIQTPCSRGGELGQGHLRAEFERAPAVDIHLINMCAGQGRDVIGVLTGHPRRDDVHARLVELGNRNVALTRQAAGLMERRRACAAS